MSDETPPNVKIYDRPAPKGPSPIILVICVLAALVVGFFVYRAFQAPAGPAAGAVRTGDSRTYRAIPGTVRENFSARIFRYEG